MDPTSNKNKSVNANRIQVKQFISFILPSKTSSSQEDHSNSPSVTSNDSSREGPEVLVKEANQLFDKWF
jgi:hypothetical protein